MKKLLLVIVSALMIGCTNSAPAAKDTELPSIEDRFAQMDRNFDKMLKENNATTYYEVSALNRVLYLSRFDDVICSKKTDLQREHHCFGGNSIGYYSNMHLSEDEYEVFINN